MSVRLCFLYPGFEVAEDDLPWLVEALFDGDATAEIVHTPIDRDAHTVEALYDLGAQWRLREGVAMREDVPCSSVIWACTSGSFVYGWEGAQRQVAELSEHCGLPSSSTSLAFVNALRELSLKRVSIAATYPDEVTKCLVGLLTDAGFEVLSSASSDIPTAAAAGRVEREAVLELARTGDHPEAEVVLVPDTALHTVRWLPDLEEVVGKPVLTANQVTVWEAARLAGLNAAGSSLGTLLDARRTGSAAN